MRDSFFSRIAKFVSKLKVHIWFDRWVREVGSRGGREAAVVAHRLFLPRVVALQWYKTREVRVHDATAMLLHWQRWRQYRVQLFRIGAAVMRHQIYLYLSRGFLYWKNATQVALRKQVMDFQLSGEKSTSVAPLNPQHQKAHLLRHCPVLLLDRANSSAPPYPQHYSTYQLEFK